MKAQDMSPLPSPSAAVSSPPDEACDAWAFEWVERSAQPEAAHVTGRLRWGGFDLAFEIDGLEGVDVQQVVLHHFADQCLQALPPGPLSGMALLSVQWHADAVEMQGPLAFTLSRSDARGISRGRLTALDAAEQAGLMDALASRGWPLPVAWALLPGHLQVGTLDLAPDELAGLAVGDLVWVDGAELSPSGLRVQFHAQDGGAGCSAWFKRSALTRDAGPSAPQIEASPPALSLRSQTLWVARAWLQGSLAAQRLPSPALDATWTACRGGQPLFAGRLMVVGRRIGLRVTHVQTSAADETTG
jgi:hypothetical protein